MIEAIHKQLLAELDRAGRSDTVFILSGVSFNLLVLVINWIQAISIASTYRESIIVNYVIFFIFMTGTLLVSGACLLTLLNSRKICMEIHDALSKIYEDTEVAKYMPERMSELGAKRFTLSFIVVGGTGLIAVAVPAVTVLLS